MFRLIKMIKDKGRWRIFKLKLIDARPVSYTHLDVYKRQLQARLEVHPVYVKNAAGMFVERRTRNVRMIPQKVVYTISYKPWQGTYYIHHIRGDLHFKVKRVKMLFGSRDLHIWFEMITCKVDTEQVVVFPRTDRLPTRTTVSYTHLSLGYCIGDTESTYYIFGNEEGYEVEESSPYYSLKGSKHPGRYDGSY